MITRQDYELEASLSPASTCSTSAARTVHRCEPYQTREQTLQLALGQGVEIDIPNARIGTRALQPTKENLGGTGIRDCAPPQTTLDLRITRGSLRRPVARNGQYEEIARGIHREEYERALAPRM